MKFSNEQILYFNVILLFMFTYMLASKIISGFKTQDFNYIRIGINTVLVGFCIFNIIKYANNENNPK